MPPLLTAWHQYPVKYVFLPLGQFILFAVTKAFVLPHSAFPFKIMFVTCDPTVFDKVKHKLFKNYLTTKRHHIQFQLFLHKKQEPSYYR